MIPGNLYVISAPSGAGKTSLVRALLQSVPQLEVSVSHTTRAPRSNEKEGVDYHFVNEEQFTTLIKQNDLLEYATVFGHYYGTSKFQLDEKLKASIDMILEIDWQGAQQVRRKIPELSSIFILPPSWEVLEKRLRNRGQDGEATITERLKQAKIEMQHCKDYDYLVVNDNFSIALTDLINIIQVNRLKSIAQQEKLADLLKSLA